MPATVGTVIFHGGRSRISFWWEGEGVRKHFQNNFSCLEDLSALLTDDKTARDGKWKVNYTLRHNTK